MKRFAILVLVSTMLLSTACNPTRESQLNETNTLIAKRAIIAVDKYLDGDPDIRAARQAVTAEREKVDESDDRSFFLRADLTLLSTALLSEDAAKIRVARNTLAERAGMPDR